MLSLLLRKAVLVKNLAIIAAQVSRQQISQQAGYMYHMPGVRVCQPEGRLGGFPELHPTDTLGILCPGSQYCSLCSLCLLFRPAKLCFLE